MDDGDIHALTLQPIGCFETKKTGADDDGAALAAGDLQHLRHIIEIAIGENAWQLVPGNRNDEGRGAGGDHQLVVRGGDAVFAGDGLALTVDMADLRALVQGHAMGCIPVVIVNDDVFIGLFTGENWREHDAVVIDARLGVEDRDVEDTGGGLEEVFQHAARRHAVADDDEFLGPCFGHGSYSAASTKR